MFTFSPHSFSVFFQFSSFFSFSIFNVEVTYYVIGLYFLHNFSFTFFFNVNLYEFIVCVKQIFQHVPIYRTLSLTCESYQHCSCSVFPESAAVSDELVNKILHWTLLGQK